MSLVPMLVLRWTAWPDGWATFIPAAMVAMFCGGFVMASINGVLLGCVPPDARLAANSSFSFLSSALGFQLAPVAVGYCIQRFGVETASALTWAGPCCVFFA